MSVFIQNEDLLRAVVLISGAHFEVLRRGEAYRDALGETSSPQCWQRPGEDKNRSPAASKGVRVLLLDGLRGDVIRTAYGPNYGPSGDRVGLSREMVTMAQRYLLARS